MVKTHYKLKTSMKVADCPNRGEIQAEILMLPAENMKH
jgi:hypothetical protein